MSTSPVKFSTYTNTENKVVVTDVYITSEVQHLHKNGKQKFNTDFYITSEVQHLYKHGKLENGEKKISMSTGINCKKDKIFHLAHYLKES